MYRLMSKPILMSLLPRLADEFSRQVAHPHPAYQQHPRQRTFNRVVAAGNATAKLV